MHYLPDQKQKKIQLRIKRRYCVDCTQILPGPGPNNVLHISSKLVRFRQSYSCVNTVILPRRVFP